MQIIEIDSDLKGQFIRLPSEFTINSRTVAIKRIGRTILLLPEEVDPWDAFEAGLGQFSDDYMSNRSQPRDVDVREELP